MEDESSEREVLNPWTLLFMNIIIIGSVFFSNVPLFFGTSFLAGILFMRLASGSIWGNDGLGDGVVWESGEENGGGGAVIVAGEGIGDFRDDSDICAVGDGGGIDFGGEIGGDWDLVSFSSMDLDGKGGGDDACDISGDRSRVSSMDLDGKSGGFGWDSNSSVAFNIIDGEDGGVLASCGGGIGSSFDFGDNGDKGKDFGSGGDCG
ncbi:transmembrane protein [Arabidopsis thaliana]|uniref:Transmembrane protein n=2 Tax=Arabidopsis thaliana TaxID=3702 RepID=A0A1P8B664_ARATH|nr:uncharacterized protein AT4G00889 [Arabidopsis thaliana]ANM67082.1 transmembrane protein [Arabidopsis thaliana]CAA0392883.1 unnamed protein product [Arabidopsis thaliana]|eukprot:NP_001328934.1 transmembrane protein [Arabidopsis thaliana]